MIAQITIPLPLAVFFCVLAFLVGAGAVYFFDRGSSRNAPKEGQD